MNILLLPIGKRAYLIEYFQDALAGQGEVHASNSEMQPAMLVADKYFISPTMFSPGYKDSILNYCIENKINAVIPLTDLNLPVFSKAKSEFLSHGIKIIVADYDIVEACNDKWLTHLYMEKNNILTPQSFLSKQEFINSINKGECSYPVVIKPRFGMGSIGVFIAEDESELDLYLAVSDKVIRKSFLKNTISADIKHASIIQSKINGVEYGLDVVNDLNGNHRATFIKHKLGIIAGESNPIVFESHEPILKLGKQIGETLRHPANCNVDCMFSEDKVYALDLNPRFGGCYPFSQLAGANVPRAIVKWLSGGEPDECDLKVNIGTFCYKDNVAKIGIMS